jgi:hypothetical protein
MPLDILTSHERRYLLKERKNCPELARLTSAKAFYEEIPMAKVLGLLTTSCFATLILATPVLAYHSGGGGGAPFPLIGAGLPVLAVVAGGGYLIARLLKRKAN